MQGQGRLHQRCRQVVFLSVVHLFVHCIPTALTSHTVPPPVPKHTQHDDNSPLATCPGGAGIMVTAWSALENMSQNSNTSSMVTANDFGARGYLTGVAISWNIGDALFPVYRQAMLVFGGRGSSGDIKSDAWMIPITRNDSSMPTLSHATLIETNGDAAPARWGHSAVWAGRGADKPETWATPRSYAAIIDENDDLISEQGHPIQDIRHTISGKFHAITSTMAPCIGGNVLHKYTNLPCDSSHGQAGGCSCVHLDVQSRTRGVLDRDSLLNQSSSSSLYPSVWSGRRLEIIAGPGRGYEGYISYNSAEHVYNLAPALDVQLGLSEDTSHFVITEAGPVRTSSVPLDCLWVFGGRDNMSNLTNSIYALTTSMPSNLDGVTAASSVNYQYSATGVEDYTHTTHGWFYEKSALVDYGTPLRPTAGPRSPVILQKGPAETSVCGEYGSILGGFELLGPYNVLSKTYITSSLHNSVQISFDFVKIDFWDGQEIQLSVDGRMVWSRQFRSLSNATIHEPQICGRDDPPGFRGETLVHVNVTVPHANATVTLSLRLYTPPPNTTEMNTTTTSVDTSTNVTATTTTTTTSDSSAMSDSYTSRDCWWGLRRVHVRTLPRGFAWREVHVRGSMPSARAHHAAAHFREVMFVFGGSSAQAVPSLENESLVFTNFSGMSDTKLGDLWSFNTTSETWDMIHVAEANLTLQPPDRHGRYQTGPMSRSHHTFVKGRGDALILFGGQAQSGLFMSEVHILQARHLIWETAVTLGSGPGARAGHASVTSGGRMWVYGGYRMQVHTRNVRLDSRLYYLALSDLTWYQPPAPTSNFPMRYGAALINAPSGTFAIVAGATATPRPGLAGVFPSGSPTAPGMDVSVLVDAHLAQLVCAPQEVPKDSMLQHRAHLTCNSMGEMDWLRTETSLLETKGTQEIFVLEKRLTAAYLAAAVRRDQYGTDVDWLDYEVTQYTDRVETLVREGKVYTDQMSSLAQARRNRVAIEIHHVFYSQELEGKKLALHMQLDETRQRYTKAIERLQLRESLVTRRKAEGALSAGTQHSCAINAQDHVQCWGLNDIHQCNAPRHVTFRAIAAGDHSTCAIRQTDSRIECWGTNSFGKSTPSPAIASKPFIELSAGGGHVCGIQKGGEMSCFGDNREGQSSAPTVVGGQFVMVSAGYAHTCALRAVDSNQLARRHGRIECWGKPGDQRLKTPSGVFKWVSAGGKHTCAVDLQGHLHCWGSNSHQQIAAPRTTFSTVTAGHLHSCGIRSNGDGECWGSNVFGQAKVPSKKRWQALSAGVCLSVVVCYSVLQCVAVCCSMLQCVAVCHTVCAGLCLIGGSICKNVCISLVLLQCVAVFCSVLQCIAVCCSVLQCAAVCCSV